VAAVGRQTLLAPGSHALASPASRCRPHLGLLPLGRQQQHRPSGLAAATVVAAAAHSALLPLPSSAIYCSSSGRAAGTRRSDTCTQARVRWGGSTTDDRRARQHRGSARARALSLSLSLYQPSPVHTHFASPLSTRPRRTRAQHHAGMGTYSPGVSCSAKKASACVHRRRRFTQRPPHSRMATPPTTPSDRGAGEDNGIGHNKN
jgi:hypothetical protein